MRSRESNLSSCQEQTRQCNGVTRVVALVHDECIGVGNVYHLFRLPEDLEQGIQRTLQEAESSQMIADLIASQEAALDYLDSLAGLPVEMAEGPVRISVERLICTRRAAVQPWQPTTSRASVTTS